MSEENAEVIIGENTVTYDAGFEYLIPAEKGYYIEPFNLSGYLTGVETMFFNDKKDEAITDARARIDQCRRYLELDQSLMTAWPVNISGMEAESDEVESTGEQWDIPSYVKNLYPTGIPPNLPTGMTYTDVVDKVRATKLVLDQIVYQQ